MVVGIVVLTPALILVPNPAELPLLSLEWLLIGAGFVCLVLGFIILTSEVEIPPDH